MALISNNNIETNKNELLFEVDAASFEAALNSTYLKSRNTITIPGFRKGKAPRKMIEKMYGDQVFYEEALNNLIPNEIVKALEENNIDIVDRPEIDVTSADKDGVKFKATVTLRPDVEISDYKGIAVTKTVKTADDAAVNEEIEKLRNRNARLVTVDDRAAQNGDTAIINFEGFHNGEPFDGGKADDFSLELGSGQFVAGFEEQIVGHNTGDEFDVEVTFPADYHVETLKGEPATFKVKLNEIKYKELPAIDDDLVKDSTEFETLDAYKADVKEKLEEKFKKSADTEVENKIFEQIINNVKGEIPQVMFENHIDDMVKEFANKLAAQGIKLEMYLQYTGMEMPAFRKTFEERAKNEVTLRLGLEKIGKLENVTVEDSDVEDEYKRIAEFYGVTLEQCKATLSPESIRDDVFVAKSAKIVTDSAVITEA